MKTALAFIHGRFHADPTAIVAIASAARQRIMRTDRHFKTLRRHFEGLSQTRDGARGSSSLRCTRGSRTCSIAPQPPIRLERRLRIYGAFGLDPSREARAAMTAKTARAPNGGYGADRYRSEKFGIDPDRGRERASVYAERFGVATSMGRLSPPVRGPPGRGVRRKRPKAASPWFSARTVILASANSQTPARVPSKPKHLDFLRSPRACIGAPRIRGFCPVGFVWNSLDSLVRNEPFQWVTSDPGRILF